MTKMVYEEGIHDITNEQYHQSEGISRSALMNIQRSPYHYWYECLSGMKKYTPPTSAMIIGEMTHTLVLEEHLFGDRFAVMEKSDARTKEGKAYREEFSKLATGKIVVDEDGFQQALKMSESVKGSTLCNQLIEGCSIERSIFFSHEETGIQAKARPDAWLGSLVVDLKTSADASFRGFQGSAWKYGYDLQAAFIKRALKSVGICMERFVFIVVEKCEPYAVGIYLLDDEALASGERKFNSLMSKLDLCLKSNEWPSYETQILTLPKWASFEDSE
tara:strand:+ start:1350 stop:2174 length:825 start_codon:yes stop_codon:yes gene_type:complete